MPAYYNEIDPYAAQWLRNLIAAGHIAPGYVDERSIERVRSDDLARYDQCHFFAGIGGWAFALRLAGWSDDRPVWTGSCPCQPLSSAGQRKGHADERHLWPAFYRLIEICRPATVFGEQVASRDGREWLAGVRADLEHLGYAVGAADLPASSVGAPHIRQRLWWVADARRRGPQHARHEVGGAPREAAGAEDQRQRVRADAWHGSADGGLAVADDGRREGAEVSAQPRRPGKAAPLQRGPDRRVAVADGRNACPEGQQRGGKQRQQQEYGRSDSRLADARHGRGAARPARREHQERPPVGERFTSCGADGGLGDPGRARPPAPECEDLRGARRGEEGRAASEPSGSFWSDAILVGCADGKARRIAPGVQPLVDGLPIAVDGLGPVSRVGALRGAGNAIVPQVAAAFVREVMGIEP